MKKENGITLVAMALTVLIMGILASVTIYYATPIIKNTKLQNLNTNMLLIQAKAKTIGENAKFNNDETKYIGQKLSENTSNETIANLINKGIVDVSNNVYLLTKEDLGKLGLSKIDYEAGYIVNYDTDEVIYVKGFKYENNVYYKLSDTKNLKFDK